MSKPNSQVNPAPLTEARLQELLAEQTAVEEEFTFMKNDVNRIKAVLREKLGVSID